METLGKLLSPLSLGGAAVQDTVKLVVIGGTVETARRMSSSAWSSFVDSFFLTAHFSQDDVPYDWLMHWLAKQPAFGKSREFDITTRQVSSRTKTSPGGVEQEDEEENEEEDGFVNGRKKKKVVFMPCQDTTHNIYYHGHLLRITRSKRQGEYGNWCQEIKISVVARNNSVIKQLVMEAKKMYEADTEQWIHIYLADSHGYWRWNGARQKRPLSSIVLEPGVKEMIVADCKDFLRSEDWYAERGIPYRRGYLLHGVPGSGKSSLIHALAGELGLDIYVASLSAKGMTDTMLMNLMGRVPTRCIVLLEDLDASFTRSVNRDASSTGAPKASSSSSTSSSTSSSKSKDKDKDNSNDGNSLSLSGLLNALDGVAASEGRLLFATTNHIERLDPALSRPGRMDVWINFKNATKYQAEGIFKCFFPSKSKSGDDETPEPQNLAQTPRKKQASSNRILLEAEELEKLSKEFADAIPENEMSVASLQGYLLKNKSRPREAVAEAPEWVITERETRAKLKKEKEEREAQAKKEAEEAAAKKEAAKATSSKPKAVTLPPPPPLVPNSTDLLIAAVEAIDIGQPSKAASTSDTSTDTKDKWVDVAKPSEAETVCTTCSCSQAKKVAESQEATSTTTENTAA